MIWLDILICLGLTDGWHGKDRWLTKENFAASLLRQSIESKAGMKECLKYELRVSLDSHTSADQSAMCTVHLYHQSCRHLKCCEF